MHTSTLSVIQLTVNTNAPSYNSRVYQVLFMFFKGPENYLPV